MKKGPAGAPFVCLTRLHSQLGRRRWRLTSYMQASASLSASSTVLLAGSMATTPTLAPG